MARLAHLNRLAIQAAVGLIVALSGVSVALSQAPAPAPVKPAGPSPAQTQTPVKPPEAPAPAQPKEKSPGSSAPEEWKRVLQDEVDIAAARVQGKRAEVKLAKSRLAQLQEVHAYVQKNYKRGIAAENTVTMGRLDLEAHEALLEMREAELKEREVRLAAAKRALERGLPPTTSPSAHHDEGSLRQEWLERRVTELEFENAAAKRYVYSRPK